MACAAGNFTFGHRFMAPGKIKVRRFDDYVAALEKAKVVLDPARRRDIILYDARDLALAQGLELVEDEALLHEVAGLVEWPVVLTGEFDAAFLDIPPEVVRTTIRVNQKCFVLKDPSSGRLSHKFVLVANIEAAMAARRSPPAMGGSCKRGFPTPSFFGRPTSRSSSMTDWKSSIKSSFTKSLAPRASAPKDWKALPATLHRTPAPMNALAARAALLAKADLTSEMVGEFPELQGVMGRYYALAQGEDASVAEAIEDHYKPQGPSDRVPTAPVAISVALADKLDMLTGFFAIGEKPTGSKDPYGLRRAALGVIALILENKLRLPLRSLFDEASRRPILRRRGRSRPEVLFDELMSFFSDRLKVYLRERGARYDLIDAVFALPGQDDLLVIRIPRRGASAFPRYG